MVARLLAAGIALLATLVVFVFLFQMPPASRRPGVAENTSTLAGILNKARELSPEGLPPDWTVTKANSAHRVMVVEVEAQRLEQARNIATEIVAPVRLRGYEEILIYVHPAGGGPNAAMRRIQWTPRGGYVETVYEELP